MGYDAQGQDVSLRSPYLHIIILPPLDSEWGVNDPDNSNIHRNKGNCEYELFVVYSDGDEEILATFYKDNNVSTQYFQVRYNDTSIYHAPGTPLHGMARNDSGYYLRTRIEGNNLGRLYFRNSNRPAPKVTEDFRVRIRTQGGRTVRPGDDMQLRFGISGSPEYDTEVSEGDFVAVYDQ